MTLILKGYISEIGAFQTVAFVKSLSPQSQDRYEAVYSVLSSDEASASVGELKARIAALEGKLAEATDTLKFYANPEIYKPHPHGPAFDRRDLSFSATSTLSTLRTKQ